MLRSRVFSSLVFRLEFNELVYAVLAFAYCTSLWDEGRGECSDTYTHINNHTFKRRFHWLFRFLFCFYLPFASRLFYMQKDVRDSHTFITDSLDVVDRSVETIDRDDIISTTSTKGGPRKQPKPADLTKPTKPHQEQCICEICTCG